MRPDHRAPARRWRRAGWRPAAGRSAPVATRADDGVPYYDCRSNEYAFTSDGQYNLIYQDYTPIEDLTPDEQASCMTTVTDWAASVGMACPIGVYAY